MSSAPLTTPTSHPIGSSGGVPRSISSRGIKSGCFIRNLCSSSSLAKPSSSSRTPSPSWIRIFNLAPPPSQRQLVLHALADHLGQRADVAEEGDGGLVARRQSPAQLRVSGGAGEGRGHQRQLAPDPPPAGGRQQPPAHHPPVGGVRVRFDGREAADAAAIPDEHGAPLAVRCEALT